MSGRPGAQPPPSKEHHKSHSSAASSSHHHHSAEKHRHSFKSNALASILPPIFSKNSNGSALTPTTSGMAMFGPDAPEERVQQLRTKNDELLRQLDEQKRQLRQKQSRVSVVLLPHAPRSSS